MNLPTRAAFNLVLSDSAASSPRRPSNATAAGAPTPIVTATINAAALMNLRDRCGIMGAGNLLRARYESGVSHRPTTVRRAQEFQKISCVPGCLPRNDEVKAFGEGVAAGCHGIDVRQHPVDRDEL